MIYPQEYIRYLVHFHGDRDFFECHEILEEYWKSQEPRSDIWVALIQLAVGLYHHRRGNLVGAKKMIESHLNRLDPRDCGQLGLDYQQLTELVRDRLDEIALERPYRELNLPLVDSELLARCQAECKKRGFEWQGESSTDPELVHRHSLRDRSDVIQAREMERLKRQKARKED
ncbi:DUF309 domain-containing protein [Ammoniphilus sp. YIM 78166]|uniref:DUF309 domain-containing protein n=1 Tax=Ammoniphilus sp. YIM 78166 TaxID=1644106 RepID=UPI00106F2D38|nr:DUF309 domain-containing protein [Ammoniphilus sp. YIM 78166]